MMVASTVSVVSSYSQKRKPTLPPIESIHPSTSSFSSDYYTTQKPHNILPQTELSHMSSYPQAPPRTQQLSPLAAKDSSASDPQKPISTSETSSPKYFTGNQYQSEPPRYYSASNTTGEYSSSPITPTYSSAHSQQRKSQNFIPSATMPFQLPPPSAISAPSHRQHLQQQQQQPPPPPPPHQQRPEMVSTPSGQPKYFSNYSYEQNFESQNRVRNLAEQQPLGYHLSHQAHHQIAAPYQQHSQGHHPSQQPIGIPLTHAPQPQPQPQQHQQQPQQPQQQPPQRQQITHSFSLNNNQPPSQVPGHNYQHMANEPRQYAAVGVPRAGSPGINSRVYVSSQQPPYYPRQQSTSSISSQGPMGHHSTLSLTHHSAPNQPVLQIPSQMMQQVPVGGAESIHLPPYGVPHAHHLNYYSHQKDSESFDRHQEFEELSVASKKQKRTKRACDLCNQKRTKCDGASPTCNQCLRTNSVCSYLRQEKKRGRASEKYPKIIIRRKPTKRQRLLDKLTIIPSSGNNNNNNASNDQSANIASPSSVNMDLTPSSNNINSASITKLPGFNEIADKSLAGGNISPKHYIYGGNNNSPSSISRNQQISRNEIDSETLNKRNEQQRQIRYEEYLKSYNCRYACVELVSDQLFQYNIPLELACDAFEYYFTNSYMKIIIPSTAISKDYKSKMKPSLILAIILHPLIYDNEVSQKLKDKPYIADAFFNHVYQLLENSTKYEFDDIVAYCFLTDSMSYFKKDIDSISLTSCCVKAIDLAKKLQIHKVEEANDLNEIEKEQRRRVWWYLNLINNLSVLCLKSRRELYLNDLRDVYEPLDDDLYFSLALNDLDDNKMKNLVISKSNRTKGFNLSTLELKHGFYGINYSFSIFLSLCNDLNTYIDKSLTEEATRAGKESIQVLTRLEKNIDTKLSGAENAFTKFFVNSSYHIVKRICDTNERWDPQTVFTRAENSNVIIGKDVKSDDTSNSSDQSDVKSSHIEIGEDKRSGNADDNTNDITRLIEACEAFSSLSKIDTSFNHQTWVCCIVAFAISIELIAYLDSLSEYISSSDDKRNILLRLKYYGGLFSKAYDKLSRSHCNLDYLTITSKALKDSLKDVDNLMILNDYAPTVNKNKQKRKFLISAFNWRDGSGLMR